MVSFVSVKNDAFFNLHEIFRESKVRFDATFTKKYQKFMRCRGSE